MSRTPAYAAASATSPLAPFAVDRRAPGPRDVQIDIAYCGVCHSDLHQARGDWGGEIFPMVPGHEFAGVVSEVGRLVKGFAVGRTIFGAVARAWLDGDLTDGEAVEEMARRYGRLCGIWDKARAGANGNPASPAIRAHHRGNAPTPHDQPAWNAPDRPDAWSAAAAARNRPGSWPRAWPRGPEPPCPEASPPPGSALRM